MFELFFKIGYFIFILPILITIEGLKKLKKFLAKRGLMLDWAWTWLVILIILLIILLLLKYGYAT